VVVIAIRSSNGNAKIRWSTGQTSSVREADFGALRVNPKVKTPGPGTHDVPSLFSAGQSMAIPSAPSFSLGGGWNHESPRTDAVGPGLYSHNTSAISKRSPGWGFGSKSREKKDVKKDTPGPILLHGDNMNYHRTPRYGFGSLDRSKPTPAMPVLGTPMEEQIEMAAPGQYMPNEDASSKMKSTQICSFAPLRPETKESQRRRNSSGVPGPGAYHINAGETYTTRASPRCAMAPSSKHMALSAPSGARRTPGPDAYSVDKTHRGTISVGKSAPCWSFGGRDKRFPLDGHTI
jgi:hypothetical protein